MGWWLFWKNRRRSSDEERPPAETTEQRAAVTPPPPPCDAPRMEGFSFERPPDDGHTLQSPPAVEPDPADFAEVVRRKAADRPRRGGAIRLTERGVAPMLVPSLREQAVLYRMAARERAAVDPVAAVELWQACLELLPGDADAWFEFGQALLAARRFDAAWSAFETARHHDPAHGLACGALGFLSSLRGDHGSAVHFYGEAVAQRPECPDMRRGLDEARLAAGMVESAVTVPRHGREDDR